MDTAEELLTVEELATWLRKPKSWIYNRIDDLGIPHYKIGNHIRFKLSEVERWLDNQRAGIGPPQPNRTHSGR